jgi:hypothetical protein
MFWCKILIQNVYSIMVLLISLFAKKSQKLPSAKINWRIFLHVEEGHKNCTSGDLAGGGGEEGCALFTEKYISRPGCNLAKCAK